MCLWLVPILKLSTMASVDITNGWHSDIKGIIYVIDWRDIG